MVPPAPPGPSADEDTTWFPTTPVLRFTAAVAGIAFVVGLTAATRLAGLLPETGEQIAQLALLAVSTIGMPALVWYASRRWGSGNLVRDLGFRARWVDLPLGIAGAVALTVVLTIVNVVSQAIGVPSGSNLTEVSQEGRNVGLFLTLFVTAGIVAPLTEELLFRGMILRGLQSRWGVATSIVVQAAVFGAAHVTPGEGWGNVDLILSLTIMGVGLAGFSALTGRLGASITAHALFNCLQLSLLWWSLG